MKENITKEEASKELNKGLKKAEEVLKDEDKTEEILNRTEKKLRVIPKLGKTLAMIPTMVSMVRSYIKKEYKEIPIGTIISTLSAIIYFLSPIDIIPDFIPGAGLIDDAAVVAACLALINTDLDEYRLWRERYQIIRPLIDNVDKVHTTKLGLKRIMNNLGVDDNIVEYCKKIIKHKDSNIYKIGKNWYVEKDTVKLTINANNFCIITAHKENI